MEEVTKQKQSTTQEVLIDKLMVATLLKLEEQRDKFLKALHDQRGELDQDQVGREEEIGTSQVTNVGKNLVNSTSNDSL